MGQHPANATGLQWMVRGNTFQVCGRTMPRLPAGAYGDSELLQWLDGNHQVDKAINLATTNYPEKLDRRIISRPRRFDRILRIDAPDARMREAYFGRKLPELEPAELSRWVELSEGLP